MLLVTRVERDVMRRWLEAPDDNAALLLWQDYCRRALSPSAGERKLARIMARIVVRDGHWFWIGALDGHGRPVARVNGKLVGVAGYVWDMHGKPARQGKQLKVMCGQSRCVHPDHRQSTLLSRAERKRLQTQLSAALYDTIAWERLPGHMRATDEEAMKLGQRIRAQITRHAPAQSDSEPQARHLEPI